MPARLRLASAMSRIVRSPSTGSSVFGRPSVSDSSRRPTPAASTMPISRPPPRRRRPAATRVEASPLGNLLERNIPEREPAGHVLFPWQLGAQLGLDAQLALGVARLLLPGGGHERVVAAALEVVDEVDRLALVREREHGGQQAVSVAGA